MEHAIVSRDFISNSIDPRLTRNSSSQTPHTCPANSSGKALVRPVPPVPSVTTSVLRPKPSASTLRRYANLVFSLILPYIHTCCWVWLDQSGLGNVQWVFTFETPSVLLYTVHGRQDRQPIEHETAFFLVTQMLTRLHFSRTGQLQIRSKMCKHPHPPHRPSRSIRQEWRHHLTGP